VGRALQKARLGVLLSMNAKGTQTAPDEATFVVWSDKYETGIELIDAQHKELLVLINRLYKACLAKGDGADGEFRSAIHRMVDYVHFHFSAEVALLEKAGYPDVEDHKNHHDLLIKNILEASRDYGRGNTYVPIKFVRMLRDWVFGHIAVQDKVYAKYIAQQKKNGLLGDI